MIKCSIGLHVGCSKHLLNLHFTPDLLLCYLCLLVVMAMMLLPFLLLLLLLLEVGGKKGGREEWREGRREGGKKGGREEGREGGEGRKEGGRDELWHSLLMHSKNICVIKATIACGNFVIFSETVLWRFHHLFPFLPLWELCFLR